MRWSCMAARKSARERMQAYVDAGIDTPVLAMLPTPDAADAARFVDILARLVAEPIRPRRQLASVQLTGGRRSACRESKAGWRS